MAKPVFKVGQVVDYTDAFEYGDTQPESQPGMQHGKGTILAVHRHGTRGRHFGYDVTDERLPRGQRYLAADDRITLSLTALFPQAAAAPAAPPVNPKAAFGATKPSVGLIPPIALLHEAMAFEDGARKYGAYNWRENPVEAMTYINAMYRHLGLWLDGDEVTRDTNVHNLGAIRACCGILLDCIEAGTLIDNRPKPAPSDSVQNRLKAQKVAEQKARSEG